MRQRKLQQSIHNSLQDLADSKKHNRRSQGSLKSTKGKPGSSTKGNDASIDNIDLSLDIDGDNDSNDGTDTDSNDIFGHMTNSELRENKRKNTNSKKKEEYSSSSDEEFEGRKLRDESRTSRRSRSQGAPNTPNKVQKKRKKRFTKVGGKPGSSTRRGISSGSIGGRRRTKDAMNQSVNLLNTLSKSERLENMVLISGLYQDDKQNQKKLKKIFKFVMDSVGTGPVTDEIKWNMNLNEISSSDVEEPTQTNIIWDSWETGIPGRMGASNKHDYDEWNCHGGLDRVREMKLRAQRGKYLVPREDYDKAPYETWYEDLIFQLTNDYPELTKIWNACGRNMYRNYIAMREQYAEDYAKAKKNRTEMPNRFSSDYTIKDSQMTVK